MNYFSGLRPADTFTVTANYVASSLSEEILKRLYIPLIGLESAAVYQFLSQFVGLSQRSDEQTHYLFMNELKMNLSRFEQLRQQLEGIGLMKTYLSVDDEAQRFVYKLLSPAMPEQFFNDPMLSVFLFQVVGKERYQSLRRYFTTETIDLSNYKDVSKTYIDVFGRPKDSGRIESHGSLVKTKESYGIPVHQQNFDFDLLEMLLEQNLITREQLPKATRDLIVQLSVLYDLAPTEMRRVILKSLTSNQTISHEDLRKNARDFYQIEHAGKLPELKPVVQTVEDDRPSELTWFEMMDTTSPIERLASISQSEPTIRQKRMIEEIMEREQLPFGVMNILLEYVMFTNEMKLPQAYIEEIASNWKKLKLDSSKKAYDYVKKIQKNKHEKKVRQSSGRSYEQTPAWVEQLDQGKVEEVQTVNDSTIEEEKRKLQEELKNFWKEDKS